MARENHPRHITQPFDYAFSIGESGLYALTVAASCKSGKQTGQPGGEDLKVEIDSLQFREIPAVARAQTYDIPAAWNGSQLRGLKKTIIFILKLTAGNHTIKFIPDRGATIEAEPTIVALPDSRNITLNLENQAERGDRRPWVTIVLVDLPLQSFSADVTAQWHLIDSDDVKLIVDSQIKRNPESLFRRYWLWAGSILKKLQQSERQTPIFKENLRQGVHYIEFWADQTPTLHAVTLDIGAVTLPEEPEPPPRKRIPSVNDPKWTGNFNDDPVQIILARAIFGEARDQRLSNKSRIAVGWSVRNRVEHPKQHWGSTYHGVITQPAQYSAFDSKDENNRDNYRLVINPFDRMEPNNVKAWYLCYEIAGQVMRGEVGDPTRGSNHYYDNSRDAPDWATSETFIVRIDRFLFHKL